MMIFTPKVTCCSIQQTPWPCRCTGAVRSASPYVHLNRFEGGVIAEAAVDYYRQERGRGLGGTGGPASAVRSSLVRPNVLMYATSEDAMDHENNLT